MKKLNNKGFMMAELIVVSAVIIGTMATFYLSYSKIVIRYNKLINYYDVGTIYRIAHYHKTNTEKFANNEIESNSFNETIGNFKYNDTLYTGDCEKFKNYTSQNDEELKEYIVFFKTLPETKTGDSNDKCAILKSCQKRTGSAADLKAKCKFGYIVIDVNNS